MSHFLCGLATLGNLPPTLLLVQVETSNTVLLVPPQSGSLPASVGAGGEVAPLDASGATGEKASTAALGTPRRQRGDSWSPDGVEGIAASGTELLRFKAVASASFTLCTEQVLRRVGGWSSMRGPNEAFAMRGRSARLIFV